MQRHWGVCAFFNSIFVFCNGKDYLKYINVQFVLMTGLGFIERTLNQKFIINPGYYTRLIHQISDHDSFSEEGFCVLLEGIFEGLLQNSSSEVCE